MPLSRMATISSEVATGRRMNGRDGLNAAAFLSRAGGDGSWAAPRASLTAGLRIVRRGVPGRRRGGGRSSAAVRAGGLPHRDLGAGLELVGAVDDDRIADLEARGHGDALALGRTERHGLCRDLSLIHISEP